SVGRYYPRFPKPVTVTTEGQVAIPKPVRDRLEIRSGTTVAFEITPDGNVVLVTRGRAGGTLIPFRHALSSDRCMLAAPQSRRFWFGPNPPPAAPPGRTPHPPAIPARPRYGPIPAAESPVRASRHAAAPAPPRPPAGPVSAVPLTCESDRRFPPVPAAPLPPPRA